MVRRRRSRLCLAPCASGVSFHVIEALLTEDSLQLCPLVAPRIGFTHLLCACRLPLVKARHQHLRRTISEPSGAHRVAEGGQGFLDPCCVFDVLFDGSAALDQVRVVRLRSLWITAKQASEPMNDRA